MYFMLSSRSARVRFREWHPQPRKTVPAMGYLEPGLIDLEQELVERPFIVQGRVNALVSELIVGTLPRINWDSGTAS